MCSLTVGVSVLEVWNPKICSYLDPLRFSDHGRQSKLQNFVVNLLAGSILKSNPILDMKNAVDRVHAEPGKSVGITHHLIR